MKAIVLTDYGDVNKLELRELPEPRTAKGELKVKVTASSINPIDLKIRRGDLRSVMPVELPYVLGRDAAGEVIEVGAAVRGFSVGDRVLGLVRRGYAEYVAAPAESWAPVPTELALADAGAIPLVALTGAQLVEEAVRPRRGERVLVTGAVGSVGRAAVFACKALGARVVAGVRKRQVAEAEALGVDEVVALDDASAIERLAPIDAVADTVGGQAVAWLYPKLARGGTIGSVVGEPPGAKAHGLAIRAIVAHPDPKRLAELAQAVARRELVIPIGARFPLIEAAEAQRAAERGGVGKILLLP